MLDSKIYLSTQSRLIQFISHIVNAIMFRAHPIRHRTRVRAHSSSVPASIVRSSWASCTPTNQLWNHDRVVTGAAHLGSQILLVKPFFCDQSIKHALHETWSNLQVEIEFLKNLPMHAMILKHCIHKLEWPRIPLPILPWVTLALWLIYLAVSP